MHRGGMHTIGVSAERGERCAVQQGKRCAVFRDVVVVIESLAAVLVPQGVAKML